MGDPAKPAWEVASITIGTVISGRAVTGWMVSWFEGSWKWMACAVPEASALRIAWRSDPKPLSLLFRTLKVKMECVANDVETIVGVPVVPIRASAKTVKVPATVGLAWTTSVWLWPGWTTPTST